MIKSKEDYKHYLEADRVALKRPQHIGFRSFLKEKLIFPDHFWEFQKSLRHLEYLKNCKPGILWHVRYVISLRKFKRLSFLLHLNIGPNCFGPGLVIAHADAIGVHANARIGANCRIHTGVTIGTDAGYADRTPQIGDNAFIGPGARIFGKIEIGDNVAIGANSVVTKSFTESNITIAGVPAKKILSKYSLEDLKPATEIKKDQDLLIKE
jgi:serine O-acetyltransferase